MGTFPDALITKWELVDCANFAIALARASGWMLQVDWLTDNPKKANGEPRPENEMTRLRVYVEDDQGTIYDARGIKSIREFNDSTIKRLVNSRKNPSLRNLGVTTRAYDEFGLRDVLPVDFVNDEGINDASDAIKANTAFLGNIKERPSPAYPAYLAHRFSDGNCAIFAQALSEATGKTAVGLRIKEYLYDWGTSDRDIGDYFHSVVLNEDGTAEDAWGNQSLEVIAKRFGVRAWIIDEDYQDVVIENFKRNSPERFVKRLAEARDLIFEYR